MKITLIALFAALLSVGVVAKDSHNHDMDASNSKEAAVTVVKTDSLVPQATCPVMGSPINKKLYVDYKGQRIYVCCRGCITPIKKDPEKYIKLLKESGEAVEIIKK